jgi:S1-C subfamily serine protease
MQIETLPPGAAVIETVRLGSQGDLAGLAPGDVIVEVNHRPINGTRDIAPAIQGLHPGDQVELQISHGSNLEQTVATLAAPPSTHP